jgi:endoglucanase Acf2
MSRNKILIISWTAAAALVVGGIILFRMLNHSSNNGGISGNDTSILDKATLDKLPKKAASSADFARIANDVTPPTNSWISGLALQQKPMAVYPMPLSFQASDTGFQVGLPIISSDTKTITGGHTVGIDAQVQTATVFQLSRFDKTSATIIYKQNTTDLGKLTIAQGSPYVFYRAIRGTSIHVNASGGTLKNNTYTFQKDGRTYVIAGHDDTKITTDGSGVAVTVPVRSLVTFYSLPAGAKDVLANDSGNEITSVTTSPAITNNTSVTNFKYQTENNRPTIFSTLPYETAGGGSKVDLTYQSIYGNMVSQQGNTFSTSVPLTTASNELDLSKLTDAQKQSVINDLKTDSQNTAISAQDSYYAGKGLARLATLLDISEQLNQKDSSTKLISALNSEFSKRLGGNYFYYDTAIKGVAAQTAAFGSEDFNDHHFHYGYFIYAASILGKYDQSFVDKYKNEVNLLVADIASYESYSEFPMERNYDPYSGHSWAAGLAPFQDGNNQESSSEAINAWNGVSLWGSIIKNDTLKKTGQWMLSNEIATADKAWRNVDTSPSYLSNYASPVASLNFGGKRTYSSFFSDESNAKLGIQLIPMSPVMQAFKSDDINAKLAAQDKPNNYNVALGDYLLMYSALSNKSAAFTALDKQTNQFIDDGNSRTYIRAWIYAQ